MRYRSKNEPTWDDAPPGSPQATGSGDGYNPAQCLREEVVRFKATNRFTPMEVTGFYIQAAVVLDEHKFMIEMVKEIKRTALGEGSTKAILGHIVRLCINVEKRTKTWTRIDRRGSNPPNAPHELPPTKTP
jgi:hypothetical protein